MISPYRLGDLVFMWVEEEDQKLILSDYPDSIGARFILEKRKNQHRDNVTIMYDIVTDLLKRENDIIPSDVNDSTVIHLRLGDVIAGTSEHEQGKRPLSIDYLKEELKDNTDKRYVMGKCFFARASSTNYFECVKKSNAYLQSVITELDAEYFDSGNADTDLLFGIKSKLFVQGKGYFSKLIVCLRDRMGLPNICCVTTTTL
jgi:hypothetical protein